MSLLLRGECPDAVIEGFLELPLWVTQYLGLPVRVRALVEERV